MLTFSETVLNAAIWILTAAGLLFACRAARRRRKQSRPTAGATRKGCSGRNSL